MDIKQLFEDDNAVSPVIGVILMVAITVILAAVIASFVLGLGDQTGDQAPQASIECNTNDDYMNHTGGENLTKSNLDVNNGGSLNGDGPYSAGDIIINNESAGDDEVKPDTELVWDNPSSDSSSIIAEC